MVWVGYGISAKVPEPVARRVEDVLLEIIRSPEFAAYNERQGGAETVAGSGEQGNGAAGKDGLVVRVGMDLSLIHR